MFPIYPKKPRVPLSSTNGFLVSSRTVYRFECPSTALMVPGTWCRAYGPGPWTRAGGPGPMGLGPWAREDGPGPLGSGTRARVHGAGDLGHNDAMRFDNT